MQLSELLESVGLVIDLVGCGIICFGFAKSIWAYVRLEAETFRQGNFPAKSKSLRQQLGAYLLLGLEFMIAADVLKTILDPEMELLIQLGVIVAIRTVISYFLGQELKELGEGYHGETGT